MLGPADFGGGVQSRRRPVFTVLLVSQLVGLAGIVANALYAWGSTEGLLSVVSVLAALCPVTTVLLARLVLGERIRRVQEGGVLAALAGVVLMASG